MKFISVCILTFLFVSCASKSKIVSLKSSGADKSEYEVIPPVEYNKLKAIRDAYVSIDGLDKKYSNRRHKNDLLYHIYVPSNLKPGKKYPLVTFLHGYTDLTIDTHKGFPKGVWSLPLVQEDHPHILFVPRHRTTKDKWTQESYREMTIEALDDLIKEFNGDPNYPGIDTSRLYITGFSQGGMGTWDFIKYYPNKFAAASPLSGYYNGPQTVEEANRLKHIPIWIFNGIDNGVKGSRDSFKVLKQAGAKDVSYHEYPGQGHVIDDFAYFTPGFMDWLFSQQKK